MADRALRRGSSHADMFITHVPWTRAMRYASFVLCRREKKSERRREGGGSRGRQRTPLRFHVTGDTMTLYVSLNISHVRVEPQKEARGIPRLIAPRLQDPQVPRDLKGRSNMSLEELRTLRTDFPGAWEITGKRVSLFHPFPR